VPWAGGAVARAVFLKSWRGQFGKRFLPSVERILGPFQTQARLLSKSGYRIVLKKFREIIAITPSVSY